MSAIRCAKSAPVDGVTMREVAASLGTSPMSIYTYVSSKDTLLDLMHCEISARIYDSSSEGSWRAELFVLCVRTHRIFLDHPRWLELGTRRHAALPPIPARERLLSSMTADGMPLEVAWLALMGELTTTVAHAKLELSMRGPENKDILTTRMERNRLLVESQPRETLTLTGTRRPCLARVRRRRGIFVRHEGVCAWYRHGPRGPARTGYEPNARLRRGRF